MDTSRISAFDDKARRYDAEFTATALGRELRARVWSRLAAIFEGRERILELGCGTGEDAIWLARAGHRVVAIDASAEMIHQARRKALAAGCEGRVEFHCLPIEELDALPSDSPFDGVFSNFGAINCVMDIAGLSARLALRVKAASPLLFVVMGRYVPWEWAWFLMRGDWQRAFRRLKRSGTPWRGLSVHYPSPRALASELAPQFRTNRRSALGFALPPTYAGHWFESSARALACLSALDRHTSRFTASLADHYVLEASRA